MEVIQLKEESSTVTITPGVLSVMIYGGRVMQLWCVDSLDSLLQVSTHTVANVVILSPIPISWQLGNCETLKDGSS